MDVGDYITSTVAVAQGTVATAATYVMVMPDGNTASGSGSTADGGATFTAQQLITAAGWGRTRCKNRGPGAGLKHRGWFVRPAPTGWGVWPPSLADLKLDMTRDAQKDTSDQALTQVLDTAIQFVIDRKAGLINFHEGDESESELADPDYTLILGTLRLAESWHAMRGAQLGVLDLGELGATRVSSGSPVADRLLKLGRYAPALFA